MKLKRLTFYTFHKPKKTYAKDILAEEIKILKEKLEENMEFKCTDEKIKRAAHKRNELRKTRWNYYALQGATPPAMKASKSNGNTCTGNVQLRCRCPTRKL